MIPASIDATLPANVRAAIQYAMDNISVCEDPPGSNRAPEIDAWAKEFGSPLGSPWCALAVAKARKSGGLWIPDHDAGACDEWLYEARFNGLVSNTPEPGAAVLYTNGKRIAAGRYNGQLDAVHIGLVVRIAPLPFAIEGNTTLDRFDRDGYVQTLKKIDLTRVLCYIKPGGAT